ncbi:MAG: nitroreductase family protein [bacterium]|nr:nitroreductase family protein [bacterium]
MDTFAAIAERRSVKKFDPDHAMPEPEVSRLMEAVILSPTSFNMQNWRFVLVTDPEVKQAVRAAGWDQAQYTDCSLLVFVCGDRGAYGRDTGRYWATADQATRDAIVPMIVGAYGGRLELQRDENLRSGALASQTLMLAAKAMDYDSCPMIGFDFEQVAEIINLPDDHDIVMAVTVGKALEPARPRGGQLPLAEVVVRDRFPG